MTIRAMICGSSGLTLTVEERAFFAHTRPAGYILFQRNCDNRDQIRELVDCVRGCLDYQPLVLIDQEGGRVQRLAPPNWHSYPAGQTIGRLFEQDNELGIEFARLSARLIGGDLHDLGINMDCLPVLDLARPGGHRVIGSRAYHSDPHIVTALGRAASEGLLSAGVLPVVKHIPGHGRAGVDSHEALPIVDTPLSELESTDFEPFRALNDMPAAMTAHVLYTGLDAVRPGTTSPGIISKVIRGFIGFDGLLMSDDVSMGALNGSIAERADALFFAGCDVALHCNGEISEMEELAGCSPGLDGGSLARFNRALGQIGDPAPFDPEIGWRRLQELNGYLGNRAEEI